MIEESISEILTMCQKALYHCKTKTDPLRQEQLFSCIEVALSQVERGVRLCQLARAWELIEEARRGNGIAEAIVRGRDFLLVNKSRKMASAGDKEEEENL